MPHAPLGIFGFGIASLGWLFVKAEERRWRREYAERRLAYDRLRRHGCPALEAMRVSQCRWAAEEAIKAWSPKEPSWFTTCDGECCKTEGLVPCEAS